MSLLDQFGVTGGERDPYSAHALFAKMHNMWTERFGNYDCLVIWLHPNCDLCGWKDSPTTPLELMPCISQPAGNLSRRNFSILTLVSAALGRLAARGRGEGLQGMVLHSLAGRTTPLSSRASDENNKTCFGSDGKFCN